MNAIVFQPAGFLNFIALGGIPRAFGEAYSATKAALNSKVMARAFAACSTQVLNSGDPVTDSRYMVAAGLYIPPGIYDLLTASFNSGGLNLNIAIQGAGPNLTTFNLPSGEYLIDEPGLFLQGTIRGFSTEGGKGLARFSGTAINTGSTWKVFEDLTINNASECGIGSLSTDSPGWVLRNIVWRGCVRAFASAGLADAVIIENFEVTGHQYGFVFGGDTTGNNARIVNGSFFDFADSTTNGIDILFVPGATASLARGVLIEGNKFGNENRNATDYYIVAAELASGNVMTGLADLSTASTDYVGFDLGPNGVYGGGAGARALFHSMTPNRNCWIGVQTFAGTPITIVELDVLARNQGTNPHSNRVLVEAGNLPLYADTNVDIVKGGGVLFVDPTGAVTGGNNIPAARHAGTDPGCTELIATSINGGANWLDNGSASAASASDLAGGTDAVEITFSASTGAYYYTLPTPITADRTLFIEFDVAPGSSLPLGFGMVHLLDNSTGTVAVWRKRFKIGAAGRTISVEIPPLIDNPGGNPFSSLTFSPGDYAGGSKTKMKIGRPRLYHAGNPVNRFTKTLQNIATWDPGSLATNASTPLQSMTVTGAALGDHVDVSFSLDAAGVLFSGYVSANNTVAYWATNLAGANPTDLSSGTVTITVTKKVGR